MSWVLDSVDDAACVRELLELHDLAAGRVVCHPRPGATWAVLVEDLLRALGKHPRALSRERRTADGPELLRVWLGGEGVRHLVVLRAHRLGPGALTGLLELAAATGTGVWLVWHHQGPPPPVGPSLGWEAAVDALLDGTAAAAAVLDERELYARAYAAARHEARAWSPDAYRLRHPTPLWNRAWPGCDVGALLQRLSIDATTETDLRIRLRAAQDGFAAEHRRLSVPQLDWTAMAVLGPRLSPETLRRLRLLACPITAAAVVLALATDAEPRFLAHHRADADTHEVVLLAGRYRIPERARPLLGAAALSHAEHGSGQPLFAPTGQVYISARRVAHIVARGARLAEIAPPRAARPIYSHNPATPFAAGITRAASVTDMIDSTDI